MKYKNNSGLKQIATINGKKEIVLSGVVIEVDRPFMHPAFEQVDESTPVTFKRMIPKLVKNNSIETLQKQITDIQKDTEGIASLSESVALTKELTRQVDELSKKTSDLDLRDDIEHLNSDVSAIKTLIEEKFTTVFKRLEILKNAVQTIEFEVDRALYGEGEDEDSTKSR
jgi:hypothetical protein